MYHTKFSLCKDEEVRSFNKARLILTNSKILWLEAFRNIYEALVGILDPTQACIHPEVPFELTIERRLKFFFLLPFLMLRKSIEKINTHPLNVQIIQRLSLWQIKQYSSITEEYERNIVLAQKADLSTNPSNKKEALYKRTVELI